MFYKAIIMFCTLQWRHDKRDGVPNHQTHDCSLKRLLKAQIKENVNAPRQKAVNPCREQS